MKKLLALALLLPLAASAQQLRLGVGANGNTPVSFLRNFDHEASPVSITPALSLAYLRPMFRKFEIGAEVAVTSWRNRADMVIIDPYNPAGGIGTARLNVFLGKPVVTLGLMAHFHPSFGRHSMRIGFYGGGVHAWGKDVNDPYPADIYVPSSNGFVAGGQLGYEFAITKEIAVGLEFAPRYAYFTAKYPPVSGRRRGVKETYSMWYFPTLATLSVRL